MLSYSLLFLLFFSPVILKGNLLAVGGDGLFIYLPNFYSRKVLWDSMLFSGFPMLADPQVMSWYPPAMLLSFIPGSWNIFIVLAYVIASSLTYGYVFTLTRSRLAATFSGMLLGLSGFMMAHLGHAVIIHAAAWIPLIIWSLEMLRNRLRAGWFAAGAIAVALCCMGGHSQIFVYGLILSASYVAVVGWDAPVGRWRYYSAAVAMIALGVASAAVQIIPAAELIGQSSRVAYSFQDFASHALPPRQALMVLFPLVFGGVRESGVLPYFGAVNQTELTGYVGLLPLLLTAVGVIATRRRSLSFFWLGVASMAFLLALGDGTPLARMTYHLPVINQLRAPARHFFEMTLAVSVLSGLGVAAIINRQVSRRLLVKIFAAAVVVIACCLVLLFLNAGYMSALATKVGVVPLGYLPWTNRAVAIPLIVFLLGVAGLWFWARDPGSALRIALLLLILLIDLGSFGWFYEWRYAEQDKNALVSTADATRYRNLLNATNQRLMPYRGPRGTLDEMPPNLTRLWGVPNASGYNVLISSRLSRLLPMIDFIDVPSPWQVPTDQSLNIVSARYFFMTQPKVVKSDSGISWLKNDMQLWLGFGCSEPRRDSLVFELPRPQFATGLALVTRLACSSQIPDGTEVVRYSLTDVKGAVHSGSLRAGLDASEWAYDCESVKPVMKHDRAKVFRSYPSNMYGKPCDGHSYLSTPEISAGAEIKSVRLDWIGPAGAIIIDQLTLIDKASGTSSPIDSTLTTTDRWRFVEERRGTRVYENLKAMPRAWMTREVVSTTAEDSLNAIKTSRLADGREFDAARIALVEEPVPFAAQGEDTQASARLLGLSDTEMEVQTSSNTPQFLVTSDIYYPGWRATIDGNETKLYRTDYVIRGVAVPAGNHVVKFAFRPRRFYLGAGISLLSLILLVGLTFRGLFQLRPQNPDHPAAL